MRFHHAGKHHDGSTENLLDTGNEERAIGGFTGCGGGEDMGLRHACLFAQRMKPVQGRDGALDCLLVETPCRGNALPQSAKDLFVEQNSRRAGQAFIDYLANRVGTDIDDSDRPALGQASLRTSLWSTSGIALAAFPATVRGRQIRGL